MSRLIDADALVDALMTYSWRDEDERLIDDADEKREYIKQWLPDLPTVGGWISVKDRLPESSGLKVIVSAKTTPESALQTKAVFVAFLGYGDGKWYTPDVDFMASAKTGNDNVHPVWEITHWMPLPEPPKEED